MTSIIDHTSVLQAKTTTKANIPTIIMKAKYESVWKSIIRPPRDIYEIASLGPVDFDYQGAAYHRNDFVLTNSRGHVLQCSHFTPNKGDPAALPCVVYLHSNLGSRVEALGVLHVLLPAGITVFCFDFSGSGLSEGEYVSLGNWEKDDLACVLKNLRSLNSTRQISLWGRGMGAVAALLQMKEDQSIAAAILDSAYKSLPELAKELAHRVVSAPDLLINQVIKKTFCKSVRKRANFDMMALVPIQDLDGIRTPALFAAALQDSYIDPLNSEALLHAYGAKVKKIIKFEGDHNSPRPLFFLQEATRFLVETFNLAATA